MISEKVATNILKLINNESKVLDIGGARYPWWRADYILDKRQFHEKVGDTAWAGSTIKEERFDFKSWIVHDFYDLPWPFPDKFFDFSLCMGTLEDLRDPIIIAKEIQRVSKAGYISTPTRAWETSYINNTHSAVKQLIGYIHHRWLVEINNGDLIFKYKSPLPYQYDKYVIKNPVQQTLHYFWADSFEVREEYYGSTETYLNDYSSFTEKYTNQNKFENAYQDIFIDKIFDDKITKDDIVELIDYPLISDNVKKNNSIFRRSINSKIIKKLRLR